MRSLEANDFQGYVVSIFRLQLELLYESETAALSSFPRSRALGARGRATWTPPAMRVSMECLLGCLACCAWVAQGVPTVTDATRDGRHDAVQQVSSDLNCFVLTRSYEVGFPHGIRTLRSVRRKNFIVVRNPLSLLSEVL